MTKKTILILGADGLAGHTIYNYFSNKGTFKVIGTSRKNDSFEHFEINKIQFYLNKIIKTCGKIDYVINCIGETEMNKDITTLLKVNSIFPNLLAYNLKSSKSFLIHISSDSVYSEISKKATENTLPSPTTSYAISKFLGEPKMENTLSIRTSILGMSANRKNGLLDWARKKSETIHGFVNQNWSGCTSLQLAIFCHDLIRNDLLNTFKSNVVNFAPLGPVSKYEILNEAYRSGIISAKVIKSKSSKKVTRKLTSIYFDKKKLNIYTCDVFEALVKLKEFENI